MDYYKVIKNKLIENENYAKIKDYSKEKYKLNIYYEVGKILSEAGKNYGDGIIKQYSSKLQYEVGKKYNERTLRRIRQFYNKFKNIKWSQMATELSWSHYCELLSISNLDEIKYYVN